jgi:hypothetical protein
LKPVTDCPAIQLNNFEYFLPPFNTQKKGALPYNYVVHFHNSFIDSLVTENLVFSETRCINSSKSEITDSDENTEKKLCKKFERVCFNESNPLLTGLFGSNLENIPPDEISRHQNGYVGFFSVI